MVAGKPCTGSLAATPSGSLVSMTPTVLLVGNVSHISANMLATMSKPQKKWYVHSKPFFGSPLRPKNQACHGSSEVTQGTPASSHWSATGLVVSDVDEAIMMSTLSSLISCDALSEARFGLSRLARLRLSPATW